MALSNPLFLNSERLNEAYGNYGRRSLKMSPPEEADATRRIQKALLMVLGEQRTKQFFPNGLDKEPHGRYDHGMVWAVIEFQQRVFPGQMQRHDGRVGKDTLDMLERELRGHNESLPNHGVVISEDPRDILVFMTGAKDRTQVGGKIEPASELTEEAGIFESTVKREGRGRRFLGFKGSLAGGPNGGANVELLLSVIARDFDPASKIIMYGYSAGALQLLRFSERLDQLNLSRSKAGKPVILVDLMVTNDAAAKEKTMFIRRVVGGSVRKNINVFQENEQEAEAFGADFSHGGPNTAAPSAVDNRVCAITNLAPMNATSLEEAIRRQTSPHAVMEQLGFRRTLPMMVKEMQEGRAAVMRR